MPSSVHQKELINLSPFLKGAYFIVLLILLGNIIFTAFYLLHDYQYLSRWYLSLGDYMYRKEHWQEKFFTHATKSKGNVFAAIWGIISLTISVWMLVKQKLLIPKKSPFYLPPFRHYLWYVLIALLCITFWILGKKMIQTSYDEIFSAVYCSGTHPIHTISYYMLPNNHILFNLINGAFAHLFSDNILSGRIISLLAYIVLICILFDWLYKITNNTWLAFVAILPIALQFTTWGFSFQARGYELFLLCSWISFISLHKYSINRELKHLQISSAYNIICFMIIPSYMYQLAAQVLLMTGLQLMNRSIDKQWWKYLIITFVGIFLFYLPVICFSGRSSIAGNGYVNVFDTSLNTFLPIFYSYSKYIVNFCFSSLFGKDNPLNYLLLLIPLVLLFSPKMLWVTFLLILFYMKMPAPIRTLNFHVSYTIAMVIYSIYFIINSASKFIGKYSLYVTIAAFSICTLLLSIHIGKTDKRELNENLYGYSILGVYDANMQSILHMTHGSRVGFSYESFYWYFHCKRQGYICSFSPVGNEDYYVIRSGEVPPPFLAQKYILQYSCEDDYFIYKLLNNH